MQTKEKSKTPPTESELAEAKTRPAKVTASSDLASNLESLHEKLEKLEDTVDRLRRRTPSVFGRFLSDLAKVIFLAAVVTVAWQTGLIDRFLEWVTSLDLSFGGDPGVDGGEGVDPSAAPNIEARTTSQP